MIAAGVAQVIVGMFLTGVKPDILQDRHVGRRYARKQGNCGSSGAEEIPNCDRLIVERICGRSGEGTRRAERAVSVAEQNRQARIARGLPLYDDGNIDFSVAVEIPGNHLTLISCGSGRHSRTDGVPTVKVPSPLPVSIVMVWFIKSETTRSALPSPLKSPTATPVGI